MSATSATTPSLDALLNVWEVADYPSPTSVRRLAELRAAYQEDLCRALQPSAPSSELAEALDVLDLEIVRCGRKSWAGTIAAELDRRAAEIERLKKRLVDGGTQAFHLHADRCDEIAAMRAELATTQANTLAAIDVLKAGIERHRGADDVMCECGGCRAMHAAILHLKGVEQAT